MIANVMVAPPMPFLPAEAHGQLVVMALLVYAGEAAAGSGPWPCSGPWPRHWPTCSSRCRTPACSRADDDMEVIEESARSLFCDTVDATAAKTVVEHLEASTASWPWPSCGSSAGPWPGCRRRRPPSPTAAGP